MFKTQILIVTHFRIKKILDAKLWSKVIRLIPLTLLANFIELFSVALLFPVIQLILNPDIFESNDNMRVFFESIGINSEKNAVLFAFGFLLMVFILKNLIYFKVLQKQSNTQFKIASEIVMQRFSNYLIQNHTFLSKNNIAVLLRNVTQIPYEFVSFIIIPYVNIINELIVLILLSIAIFIYNPILFGALALFSIPAMIIYTRVYRKELHEISNRRDFYGAEQYKMALDSLENFTEIKIFQKTAFFIPKFRKMTEEFEKTMAKSNLLNVFSPKIIETIAIASIFSVVLIGYLTSTTSAQMVSFLILFSVIAFRIIPSLNKLILSINYIKGSEHVFKYLENMDSELDHLKSSENNQIEPLTFENKITFNGINFSYENDTKNIFQELNFQLRKGSKIGIIGESGSGKSSFLSLMLRFRIESSGEIFVDNEKITEDNVDRWYKLISYVPQSVQLINGTIAQNIAFGIENENIDFSKVNQIIKAMNLEEFVNQIPLGLNGTLGENKNAISGGQKQRIGIARALYHNRKILILDEATSALDFETEEKIVSELIELNDITVIFVTHRLEALKNFDEIHKLQDGKLQRIN